MAFTISTHTGSAVARGHNIRDRRITDKESHIDPDGLHETWRDETERHAYHRLFDKAVEDYNAKQTRADRRIKNYYADVCKDDKKHTAYEMIIAVGSRDNPVDPATGKAIMREFVDGWAARNPNMELIGAYYHADEQGVEHTHLDFIPVAHGYKRGMETQTGYAKALDEMGFHGRRGGAEWWARENQALEDICRAHGLEIEHPERGKGTEHAHTEAYQITQDAKHEAAQTCSKAVKQYSEITLSAEQTAAETRREAERLADNLQRRAEQSARDTRQAAKNDALQTRQEAQKALQAAKTDADGILSDARDKAAQIDAQAARQAQELSTLRKQAVATQAQADQQAALSDTTSRILSVVKGVHDMQGFKPEIIAETQESKSLFGKVSPATVTIKRTDFDKLREVADARAVVTGYNQAAKSLASTGKEMAASARELHMSRLTAHETSVDERVRSAEKRTADAERERDRAVRQTQAARSELQEVTAERDEARAEASELREVALYYPDFDEMRDKTRRAREMERLYYRAQNIKGQSEPGLSYNQWTGGYSYELSDGTSYDRRHLLKEYVAECQKQSIAHDSGMWEDAQQVIKSLERDRGYER